MAKPLLILLVVISCTFDNVAPYLPPQQISQPLLVGSWKMVTNKGVDVSFDIVESGGKSWSTSTILSYQGRSTVFNEDDSAGLVPIYKSILKSPAGSILLDLWADPKHNVDISDQISFYSLQPNSTYSQLTGKLGYAHVWGIDTAYRGPTGPFRDTVNFKSPIIINRVK
jgi:hypothetical protein